jgi:hypothetical protein
MTSSGIDPAIFRRVASASTNYVPAGCGMAEAVNCWCPTGATRVKSYEISGGRSVFQLIFNTYKGEMAFRYGGKMRIYYLNNYELKGGLLSSLGRRMCHKENYSLTKHYTGSRTWTDYLARSTQRNVDSDNIGRRISEKRRRDVGCVMLIAGTVEDNNYVNENPIDDILIHTYGTISVNQDECYTYCQYSNSKCYEARSLTSSGGRVPYQIQLRTEIISRKHRYNNYA